MLNKRVEIGYYLKKVVISIMVALVIFTGLGIDKSVEAQGSLSNGVLKWKDVMEEELQKYGLEEHLQLVMGIAQEESGGSVPDLMQSSESMSKPRNYITDEKASIKQAVIHLNSLFKRAKSKGADFNAVVQAYNYGIGYVDFVAKNGGKHTFELAEQFAHDNAKPKGTKVNYSNSVADRHGNWRYKYGNMFYFELVSRHLDGYTGNTDLDDSLVGVVEPSEDVRMADILYIERHTVDANTGVKLGDIPIGSEMSNWFFVFSDNAKMWMLRIGWVLSFGLMGYVSLYVLAFLTLPRGTRYEKFFTKHMIDLGEDASTNGLRGIWEVLKSSIIALSLMFLFATGIYIPLMAFVLNLLEKATRWII